MHVLYLCMCGVYVCLHVCYFMKLCMSVPCLYVCYVGVKVAYVGYALRLCVCMCVVVCYAVNVR